jgi:hypothetical protein
VIEWLKDCHEVLAMYFVLLHIISGQPNWVEEESNLKHANGNGDIRNLQLPTQGSNLHFCKFLAEIDTHQTDFCNSAK